MIAASGYDLRELRAPWRWRVPDSHAPLFISVFGDWVFGHPDGSIWVLSLLDGEYDLVARDVAEYNILNKSIEWLEQIFIADWQPIAAAHGLIPTTDECLGWKLHPFLGGRFEAANLQVFNMREYQSIMGRIHQQLQHRPILN